MDVPTVDFFRTALDEERKSLTTLCADWLHIHDTQTDMPDEVSGQIFAVTGKAKLLLNQRLAQFSRLVDDCENQTGMHKTTCMDLQGFWEMVHFQVDEIHKSFDALENLKNNNWEEVQVKSLNKKVTKRIPLHPVGNTPPQATSRSKIHQH